MAISKAQRRQFQAVADAFDAHFANEYGARWTQLKERLLRPTEYAALINAYAPSVDVDRALAENDGAQYAVLKLPRAPHGAPSAVPTRVLCLTRVDFDAACGALPFPAPHPASASDAQHRVCTHWNLDAASVLAAQCLDIQPGQAVLDMCAAPGGKSITLAQRLWPSLYADKPSEAPCTSMLHANEVDVTRHKRLQTNLQTYLPPTLFDQGLVDVLRIDATSPRAVHLFPLGEEGYDRILIDAPCSSERHILHAFARAQQSGTTAPEMLAWKPSMTRTLAKTQLALLHTAWSALRPGGRVLYATCSLSQHENDGVVRAFLASAPAHVVRTDQLWRYCEPTEFGYMALPDHTVPGTDSVSPWGPLYFSILTK